MVDLCQENSISISWVAILIKKIWQQSIRPKTTIRLCHSPPQFNMSNRFIGFSAKCGEIPANLVRSWSYSMRSWPNPTIQISTKSNSFVMVDNILTKFDSFNQFNHWNSGVVIVYPRLVMGYIIQASKLIKLSSGLTPNLT